YALQMTLNKNQAGKKLGVRVDGGEMFVVEIPKVLPTSGEALVKTTVAEIPVGKGVRQIEFTCLGEAVEFHSFTFTESTGNVFSYEQSLESAPATGMEQLWRFENARGTKRLLWYRERALARWRISGARACSIIRWNVNSVSMKRAFTPRDLSFTARGIPILPM
ncbi:MAG: hypothetical protein ACLRSW_17820, partial [Christensenellaceae bacterium]